MSFLDSREDRLDPPPPVERLSATADGSAFAPPERMRRVLFVDDEEAIAYAAQRYLLARNFAVDVAGNPGDAEALLHASAYDVLVADLRLGLAGDEGFRLIGLARRLTPDIGLVLVTAYGSDDVEARARQLGVHRVLR